MTQSMIMLDPGIKAKWIADLRSGQYAQTQNYLHNKNAYCCLGVLCLSVGARFERLVDDDGEVFDDVPVLGGENLGDGVDAELSFEFRNRIGLSKEEHVKLITMNDNGEPFTKIADYIEKNL